MSAQLLARYRFENDLKDDVSGLFGSMASGEAQFTESNINSSQYGYLVPSGTGFGATTKRVVSAEPITLGSSLTLSFWLDGLPVPLLQTTTVMTPIFIYDEILGDIFSIRITANPFTGMEVEIYAFTGESDAFHFYSESLWDAFERIGYENTPVFAWFEEHPILWVVKVDNNIPTLTLTRNGLTTEVTLFIYDEFAEYTGQLNDVSGDLNIIYETSGSEFYIDDLRIYNGIVSEEQLLDIYSGETSEPTPPEELPVAPPKYGTILRSFIYETTSEAPIKSVLLPGVLRNTIIRN